MNKESPKKREKDNAEIWTIDKIVVKGVATFMCHDETKKCKQIRGFCNKQKKVSKQSSRYRL